MYAVSAEDWLNSNHNDVALHRARLAVRWVTRIHAGKLYRHADMSIQPGHPSVNGNNNEYRQKLEVNTHYPIMCGLAAKADV